MPCAVAVLTDITDLQHLIQWAGEERISLIPRGAGSGMGGGNVGDGVIVDLTRLSGHDVVIDPANQTARTGADVTWAELDAAALPYGLRLPPDPSSGKWATLGGMVATNAAGARSVRYGSVRRWVNALTLVTIDGEVLQLRRGQSLAATPGLALARFAHDCLPAIHAAAPLIESRFPRTRKNSAGYALDSFLHSGDVIDLIVGSEGTLGIVTDIEWRLDSIPKERAGLRVGLRSLDQLADIVQSLGTLQPSALELLDQSFLDLVRSDPTGGARFAFDGIEALLLIEFERDHPGELREALETATAWARPLSYLVDTAFTRVAAERLWAIRHAASPILARLPDERRSLQVIEDACVPVALVSEYIKEVRRASAERELPVVIFGHAGDGHIHVNLLPDVTRPGWEVSVADLLDEVTGVVVRLGGTISGEHGAGRLRASGLARVYGPEILRLFQLIKESFDPIGIFNPGVILSSGENPIGRLKVGAGAVRLPPDINQALREIERTGGYQRSRLELADNLQPAT
jgi:FAD/FMN-containing dehydrogenase